MGPAHFYQFEYYNIHHNITFVLTSACPDGDTGFDRICVPPGDDKLVLTGGTMDENCRLWEGYEKVDHYMVLQAHKLCYKPRHKHNSDYILFDHQERNLGHDGGQGPRETSLEPGTCEKLCHENMDMQVLQDKNFPPSHQVEWTEVDDMCEMCK